MQIPYAERRVCCPSATTSTEDGDGISTEYRGMADKTSPLLYVDVGAGEVWSDFDTQQTMRQ